MASIIVAMDLFDQSFVEALAAANDGVVVPSCGPDGENGTWEVAAHGQLRVSRSLLGTIRRGELSDDEWEALRAGVVEGQRVEDVSEAEFVVHDPPGTTLFGLKA